jgi:hypothetical protein
MSQFFARDLKALFRPCVIIVPDFVFISEVMLFSGGSAWASGLSAKLVVIFDLCRTQLSNASHCDWGLRAMKAILSKAGKSKRLHLEENEALLLVHAIRDCTQPRLLHTDLPLFDGIVKDVFPEIEVKKVIKGRWPTSQRRMTGWATFS